MSSKLAASGRTSLNPETTRDESQSSTATALTRLAASEIKDEMKPVQLYEFCPGAAVDERQEKGFKFQCPIDSTQLIVVSRDAIVFRISQPMTGRKPASIDLFYNHKAALPRVAAEALYWEGFWEILGGQRIAMSLCFLLNEFSHMQCKEAVVEAIDELSREIEPELYDKS